MAKRNSKSIWTAVLIAVVVAVLNQLDIVDLRGLLDNNSSNRQSSPSADTRTPDQSPPRKSLPAKASKIDELYAARRSDAIVTEQGVIARVLADDTKGSQHQRFIVELDSGLSILIAHNIDLAPRVPNPSVGSVIAFRGEYEWTDRGGVVHWTHHDPAGRHPGGWLEYRGQRYE